MRRDWEVIREILFKLEELGTTRSNLRHDQVEGHPPDVVAYHMRLLGEANLIKVTCNPAQNKLICTANSMTWTGHEFLDHIRQDSVWNKVKHKANEHGVDLTLEVIGKLAKEFLNSMLGG